MLLVVFKQLILMLSFSQGRRPRRTELVREASARRRCSSSVASKQEVSLRCASGLPELTLPYHAAYYPDVPSHSHRCLVSGDDPALLPHKEVSAIPLKR